MSPVRKVAVLGVCGMFLWVGSSGCAGRTKIVTKPREDQALVGNRGYFAGTPPPSERPAAPTRTYYETEVEVPTFEVNIKLPKWRREWHDKELYGNRGYLVGGPQQSQKTAAAPAAPAPVKRASFLQPRPRPVMPEKSFTETVTYDNYTVKKGETLGEIAARPEVYGTAKAWKRIFEANEDILKDPNRIKPGQVLRIPRGGEPSKESRSSTFK